MPVSQYYVFKKKIKRNKLNIFCWSFLPKIDVQLDFKFEEEQKKKIKVRTNINLQNVIQNKTNKIKANQKAKCIERSSDMKLYLRQIGFDRFFFLNIIITILIW